MWYCGYLAKSKQNETTCNPNEGHEYTQFNGMKTKTVARTAAIRKKDVAFIYGFTNDNNIPIVHMYLSSDQMIIIICTDRDEQLDIFMSFLNKCYDDDLDIQDHKTSLMKEDFLVYADFSQISSIHVLEDTVAIMPCLPNSTLAYLPTMQPDLMDYVRNHIETWCFERSDVIVLHGLSLS